MGKTPAARLGRDPPEPTGNPEELVVLEVTADTRKALFEELLWEHRELAEAHDKCQVIPEASIDALKEQLATAQREKDELSRQHRGGAKRPQDQLPGAQVSVDSAGA
ncbi:uncharacterized protein [Lolium perenne]|uniref:uncharacterized protein n=1 Tax=Lolium perenne TaxID=4522 RepID=UPI003A993A18